MVKKVTKKNPKQEPLTWKKAIGYALLLIAIFLVAYTVTRFLLLRIG